MCLGVIGKITFREGEIGRALIGTIEAPVNLQFAPEAHINDFIMIHAGFAIKVMDPSSARDALSLLDGVAKTQARMHELSSEIARFAQGLGKIRLMEVCGTHTVAIARSGLKDLLPQNVELISGPGCPVCVTPVGEIDMAIDLALSGRAMIYTFGDMLRVPGSAINLEEARARGGQVRLVYSPRQALEAADCEDQEVVFLAVGFETTAPTIANIVKEAAARRLQNFSVLVSHRLIPPALETILSDPACGLGGLICPGHVSTIIGSAAYVDIAVNFGTPCVVAGFEPTDILEAISMLLRQIQSKRASVGNQYIRTVSAEGNLTAKHTIDEVFMVADADWRGIGTIKNSGLKLRPEYDDWNAAVKFNLSTPPSFEPKGCLCGAILAGHAGPQDCRLFGDTCTPERPTGPCMVSSEGACSAAYLYDDRGQVFNLEYKRSGLTGTED